MAPKNAIARRNSTVALQKLVLGPTSTDPEEEMDWQDVRVSLRASSNAFEFVIKKQLSPEKVLEYANTMFNDTSDEKNFLHGSALMAIYIKMRRVEYNSGKKVQVVNELAAKLGM